MYVKNADMGCVNWLILSAIMAALNQNVLAHTGPEISQISEGARTSNNIVIGHGCGDSNVIGTSVVFPDGIDSTILVDGVTHSGPLTDFVQNWANANQLIYSLAVFSHQGEKKDNNGNVVGFWAGGGNALPHDLLGYIPFRTGAVVIEPTSCAKSVKFTVNVADICEITDAAGFNDSTVQFWTHNSLGTIYDRKSEADTGATSLTVKRTSALPTSCGEGVSVEVRPSAAQMNRDMPIKLNGTQIWPK